MEYNYHYSTDYYDMSDPFFGAVMSIVMIAVAVGIIFWLVSYIIHAVGLYTIASRLGKANPWLAFVPFARAYLQGETAGVIRLKNREVRNPGIWKLVVPIIAGVVFSVFYSVILALVGISTAMAYNFSRGAAMSAGVVMIVLIFVIVFIIAAVLYEAGYAALCTLINIQIYERFTSRNMAVVHAVLSVLIPLYESICLFVMRNREFNPGMGPVNDRMGQVPPPGPEPWHFQAAVPPVNPSLNEEPAGPAGESERPQEEHNAENQAGSSPEEVSDKTVPDQELPHID